MEEIAPGLGMDHATLAGWLVAHVPQAGDLRAVTKFTGGQSNPTYRLDCAGGAFVLRTKPPGRLLPSAHAVEREFQVMRALSETQVPVPRVLASVGDADAPAGRAFFVMEHVTGRVLWDPALPGETPAARAAIYDAMNAALAQLHSLDPAAVGLGDFGKPGNYFARQLDRWRGQYLACTDAPLPDMLWLMDWLAEALPADDGAAALVHGDWRLDNMIFVAEGADILAVLDWELSTLGHPLADLAYQCMQWRLPHVGKMRGLGGLDRAALGLPSEADYVAAYAARRGVQIDNWPFYLGFAFFRLAAILAGVAARAAGGNASNPALAVEYGKAVPVLAAMARGVTTE